jgi:hypothetical protein
MHRPKVLVLSKTFALTWCISPCQSTGGGMPRRCLLVRAKCAAAAGHSGAQVSVLGADAAGARVEVWWPEDEQWYKGVVTHFDR